MIRLMVAVLVLGLAGSAWAQKKPYEELKGEIVAKIKKNGVDKFSLDVVRDTFMKIESPEHPIPIHVMAAAGAPLTFSTIGQFYQALIDKITELGDSIFTGDQTRQVTTDFFPSDQLFPITNVDSAVRGLQWIISEGEGTTSVPFDKEGEPAHYYRFESILRGKELMVDPSVPEGYSYSGSDIPFDPAGVWDFPDNTKAADYAAQVASRLHDRVSDLLRGLQSCFDGQAATIDDLVTRMGMLRTRATAVVSRTNPATGRQCGLTFEYMTM